MKKLLLFIGLFAPIHMHCKPDFNHRVHYNDQYSRISQLEYAIEQLKLQAKIQSKLFAIQKIVDQMQLKYELNYYLSHASTYKEDLNKLLRSVNDLVEFRWSLFSQQMNGNFIGCSLFSGICAVGLTVLLGMSVARNDVSPYIVPSIGAAGLSGLFAALSYNYYYKSKKSDEITQKLKIAQDTYINNVSCDEPFSKFKILSDYYTFLLSVLKEPEFEDSFLTTSYHQMIKKLKEDKNLLIASA